MDKYIIYLISIIGGACILGWVYIKRRHEGYVKYLQELALKLNAKFTSGGNPLQSTFKTYFTLYKFEGQHSNIPYTITVENIHREGEFFKVASPLNLPSIVFEISPKRTTFSTLPAEEVLETLESVEKQSSNTQSQNDTSKEIFFSAKQYLVTSNRIDEVLNMIEKPQIKECFNNIFTRVASVKVANNTITLFKRYSSKDLNFENITQLLDSLSVLLQNIKNGVS